MKARIALSLLVLAACDPGSDITVIDGPGLFDPPTLDFGTRSLTGTHELTTRLTMPAGADTLQVTDVRFEPPIDAYAARTETGVLRGAILTRGNPLNIKVLFAPRSAGNYDASMLVVFQDQRAVRLGLRAAGAGDGSDNVALLPATLDFAGIEVGREVIRTIEIENRGEQIAVIRDVRLAGTGFPARPSDSPLWATNEGTNVLLADRSIGPQEKIRVDVHFRPRVAGEVSDGLLFVLQAGSAVRLNVLGSVIAAGSLICEPSDLAFGTLIRGQSRDIPLTCTVMGGGYTLAGVSLSLGSSPVFSLSNQPLQGTRYQSGQTFNIGVRFEAQGLPADHSGDVVVSSELGQDYLVGLTAHTDPPPLANRAISVNASWNTSGTDVDLHLVRSNASPFDPLNDCYFQRKHPDWGRQNDTEDDPYLDRDDTDGFGPEEINLLTPREGQYDVYAHYYRGASGVITTVDLSVYFFGVRAHQQSRPLSSCGDLWRLGTIDFNAGQPRFTPVDTVSDARARGECP